MNWDWGTISTILGIVAPSAIMLLLAVDWVLDRVRERTGKLKEPGWMAFDQFCDEVRKIIGTGPLGNLTERGITALAGQFYDRILSVGVPIDKAFTREEFIDKVIDWYREQVAVEAATRQAYTTAIAEKSRAAIKMAGGIEV